MSTAGVSLSEVHRTVKVNQSTNAFKRLIAFLGPAYLVSVGYMDPGNWATDIQGGALFGYSLLWVLPHVKFNGSVITNIIGATWYYYRT